MATIKMIQNKGAPKYGTEMFLTKKEPRRFFFNKFVRCSPRSTTL